jgi:1-acyl-sn-glycerol-3-phosphate acyltransferase
VGLIMIRATLVYIFIALYVCLVGPLAMFWTLVAKDSRLIYSLARICVKAAGWLSGVRVRPHGLEKIAPGQNYVFLSNHQGNFDGPVLIHVIPRDVRALVKREMMRLPVLSLIMRQVKFVPKDRSDVHKARAGIDYGATLLQQGFSFFAFPEGTRSRDGRLGEFKKGVFVMAIKGQTPVMPITILNTNRIQSPGDYRIHPGTVEIIFHDPIPTRDMDLPDRDRLMESTRASIASALASAIREPAVLAN